MPDSVPNSSNSKPGNEVKEDSNLCLCVDTLKTWRPRNIPPAHYVLKIESLESFRRYLDKSKLDHYESKEFEVSGFIWKLLLYLEGDKTINGSGHISLYLEFINPWRKINALLNFFIYDQVKKEYLSIQDKKVRQFDGPKKEHRGHRRLLSLDGSRNASNGFLANDSCMFGVEIYVLKDEGEGEWFHTLRETIGKCYVWNLKRLSGLKETDHFSELFSVEKYKWKLHLCSKPNPKYLSIYLCLQLDKEDRSALYVDFKLSVKDQDQQNNSDKIARRGNAWFRADNTAWGFSDFINLAESEGLNSLTGRDEMQIELQIISISMAEPRSFSTDMKEADTGCGKEAGTDRAKDASQEDKGHESIAQ